MSASGRIFIVVAREIVVDGQTYEQGQRIAHDQLRGRAARLMQMGLIREATPEDLAAEGDE